MFVEKTCLSRRPLSTSMIVGGYFIPGARYLTAAAGMIRLAEVSVKTSVLGWDKA